uniref:Condensin-2 complex subunit H2 n=1 Tax=Leptobrachium leishanense TaxID=445787 RepID=A0A8C5WCV7_9ANUR
MEDAESRYTHLLQPIRDLTKNWEVDVASQLGEYLEELDQICISFDSGETTMNFAEAALLIQGSTCIYSKKVEYLYSLVYQALDFISNKKKDQQPTSIGADGVDKDATFAHRRDKEEFLSLDDDGDPKKTNTDMKKDQNPNLVSIVPITPMALASSEETEKKTVPLCSQKGGEVLASQKDFRMNTCTPYACGSFMLELVRRSPRKFSQRPDMQLELQGISENRETESMDCPTPVLVLNFSEEAPETNNCDADVFLPIEDVDDHHDVEDAEMEPVEHIERRQMQSEERGYVLRDRVPQQNPTTGVKSDVTDHWSSLDALEQCEEKPFKKGKSYTLPRGLVEELSSNKRKRRLPCKLKDFMTWFTSTNFGAKGAGKTRRKGPTFEDMEGLYWKHVKDRLVAQKRLQRVTAPQFAKLIDNVNADEQANPLEQLREDDDLDHDDQADDLFDLEDLGAGVPACLQEEAELGNIDPSQLCDHTSYEELVRRNVDLFITNSQKYAQETALSLIVREWEEKMGPQLQKQEDQGPFDIHEYGDRLVSQFSKVGEWRTFASMMADKEPFEVCRYMLASLQLANDYTVEVSQKPGLDLLLESSTE